MGSFKAAKLVMICYYCHKRGLLQWAIQLSEQGSSPGQAAHWHILRTASEPVGLEQSDSEGGW